MQVLNRLIDIKPFPVCASDSEDYKRTLHSLRLATCHTGVEIKELRSIQEKSSDWEKTSTTKLTIETWIKYEDIANAYKESSFQKGAMFTTGMIFKNANDIEFEADYRYILCQIAIGRSFPIKEGAILPSSKVDLPEGYDSVYRISNSKRDKNDEKDQEAQFRHEYYIYDPVQVFPLKFALFTIKQGEMQQDKEIIYCYNCEAAAAERYCIEDKACLCANCDNDIHENNEMSKILKTHKRVPISEKPVVFDKCADDKEEIRFWCDECEKPLCVKCKMINGSHSNEPFASHKVVEIDKIYKEAKSNVEKEDPSIKSKLMLIGTELKRIDAKKAEVQNKHKAIEEKIINKMKDILNVLDMEVAKKIYVLRSDECELQRRKEELEYCSVFMKDSSTITPLQFIQMWVMHNKMKNELVQRSIPVNNMQIEIKLEGERQIRIVSDSHNKIQNMEQHIVDKNKNEYAEKSMNAITSSNKKEFASTKLKSSIYSKIEAIEKDESSSKNEAYYNPLNVRMDDYSYQKDISMSAFKKREPGVQIIEDIDNSLKGNYKDSVSIEAFKRSIYGKFSENYKRFKDRITKSEELIKIVPSVFKESTLLDNAADKLVLYFNLPLTDTWFPKTKLIFHTEQQQPATINRFIQEFEQAQNETSNILLMADENSENIFGGFASEAWKTNSNKGNDKCFLFNIKNNFRFEAIKGKPYYFSAQNDTLKFGEDLVIQDDFKTAKSSLENNFNCFYAINKKYIDKEKILMGQPEVRLSKVEVWCLTG